MPILTFCAAAGLESGGKLQFSVMKVFTAFSIMILLSRPVTVLTGTLPSVAAAVASFQRIQNHINQVKRVGSRPPDDGDTRPTMDPNNEQHTMANTFELMRMSSNAGHRQSLLPDSHVMALVQGSFAWTKDAEPIFETAELAIDRNMLTIVLGPTGSGKSTLLKVLLGELPMAAGTVWRNFSTAAYCDQKPWLPNESIRDIVIGATSFDELWFRTVIQACALEHDISQWPDRESTMAGSDGFALSGGQKQRLVSSNTELRCASLAQKS